MSGERAAVYLAGLMHELWKLPVETEWVEFKRKTTIPKRSENTSPSISRCRMFWSRQFTERSGKLHNQCHHRGGPDSQNKSFRIAPRFSLRAVLEPGPGIVGEKFILVACFRPFSLDGFQVSARNDGALSIVVKNYENNQIR